MIRNPWTVAPSRTGTAAAFLSVREASSQDNASLLQLTARSPMLGRVSLCVHREPDFFALSRLQGDSMHVLVALDEGAGIVGCIGIAERRVWLNGLPTRTMLVSDFKVDPRFRGRGVGDRLTTEARAHCASVSPDIPVLFAALVGNRPIERRAPGPRGQPLFTPLGTVRVHTLFALGTSAVRWGRSLAVRAARPPDLDAIAALWGRVAPGRQGAVVLGATEFDRWVNAAPGLAVTDYLLAFRGRQLVGFLGLWDQRCFKGVQILGYNTGIAASRLCYNVVARLFRAPPLPAAGGTLNALHAVHVCVPSDEPDILRALLAEGRRRCVRLRMPALEIGLDPRDPLSSALKGLLGVRADVRCYVTAPCGRYVGPSLDTRPLHFETALV